MEDFLDGFANFFQLPSNKIDPRDTSIRAFQAIATKEGKIVTMESFGSMLNWFGPLKGLNVFENVDAVLKRGFFHGEISQDEAELRLKGKKRGTFLLRFSASSPGCFTISVYIKKGRCSHLRITRNEKFEFVYNNQTYPSIMQFISTQQKTLNLKYPCMGSPYSEIYNIGTTNGTQSVQESDYGAVE